MKNQAAQINAGGGPAAGKDMDKRRRIMSRSIKLGHCICDPQKACPCDLLKQKDVCLCAGERLEAPTGGPVRLTKMVEKAGCASKIDQLSLRRILKGLPELDDERVLVGMAAGDDAGVFRLDERTVLVQTVDVFSPSLDDPYEFGQVAAANSLSDIYAMGAEPLTALSVIGFPLYEVHDEVMRQILRGGIDKMAEAGVPVIGGHSIRDAELKAGFAVTGRVDPDRMMTNAGARAGDVLVLTKPLGTGILSFAVQIDRASPEAAAAMSRSMRTLNRAAAEVMVRRGAHAATDVTGFGLAGHLAPMAQASGVDVEIFGDDLPVLPGVLEALAGGIIPGGVERNRESSGATIVVGEGVDQRLVDLCLDPQTSGGLLIAVSVEGVAALLDDLRAAGVGQSRLIGRVREGAGQGRIYLLSGRHGIQLQDEGAGAMASNDCCAGAGNKAGGCCGDGSEAAPLASASCCDDDSSSACCAEESSACCAEESSDCCSTSSSSSSGEGCCAEEPLGGNGALAARGKFGEFLQKSTSPGELDVLTKEAISLALSLAMRCEPCLKVHLGKARRMGFSEEQIEEIANLAIAFGGAPAMMLYNGVRREK